jgi:hypothetical protein
MRFLTCMNENILIDKLETGTFRNLQALLIGSNFGNLSQMV